MALKFVEPNNGVKMDKKDISLVNWKIYFLREAVISMRDGKVELSLGHKINIKRIKSKANGVS